MQARWIGWKEREESRTLEKEGRKGRYKSSTSVLPAVAAPGGRACAFSSTPVTFHLERMFVFSERGENGSPSLTIPEETAPRLSWPYERVHYPGGQARTSFGVDALTNIHSNFTDARKTGAALRSKERNLAAGVHLLIPLSKHNEPSSAVVSLC